MFHKFPSATNINSERTEHTLALTQVRLSVLLVLYVDIEGLTFEEDLQVSIMLKNWMSRNLVQHPLQRGSP